MNYLEASKGKLTLDVAEIRRPIISCLKRSISNLDGVLYNSADYNLSKDEYGNIRIGLESDILYIHNGMDGIVQLNKSDIYNNVLKL